jgi:hypothetical protein
MLESCFVIAFSLCVHGIHPWSDDFSTPFRERLLIALMAKRAIV